MNKEDFIKLIEKYLAAEATPAEQEMLLNYYESFQNNNEWDEAALGSKESMESQLLNKLNASIDEHKNINSPTIVHRIHFLRTAWFRYAAAIILLFGVSTYLWLNNTTSNPINPLNPKNPSSDNYNRATLTLADGTKIILDSSAKGNLAQQGNLKIFNLAGKVDYEGVGSNIEYHTLTTPKGGQYQLVLADGTKVWLNAASSIKFPTAFAKERVVEITGESYLEVTPDQTKPFLVKANGTIIQVLGTSFNVNAYSDEVAVKTTLLQGAVKIGNSILKPGEAYINGEIIKANIEQDIAWRNGQFSFTDADLETVMRQLARWYDINVTYQDGVYKGKFNGEIGMKLTLKEVLDGLSKNRIKYKIENEKNVIILK